MKIKDGDWVLFDYDVQSGRQVWRLSNPDGTTTFRTDYPVKPTIDINTAQRNMTQKGWAGDYHHVASIPLNVAWDQIVEPMRQGDDAYVSKWLNDSDNRAWRTKEGRI